MSKNLKRVVALVAALSLCVSMFAMLSAQAYEATITGWSSDINSDYTWFSENAVTEKQKEQTRTAIADELAYQNNTLGFKIGTDDDGGTNWSMSSWGGMVAVQVENHNAEKTDNVGNPWSSTDNRQWGVVTAPFVGMAFSVKGTLAVGYPQSGNNPALGNEFEINGVKYQPLWNGYLTETAETVSTVKNFPGAKNASSSKDITNNKFRYAIAMYNMSNKRAGIDESGLEVGYPTAFVNSPELNTNNTTGVVFQAFTNRAGNAYVATKYDSINDGKLEGAYIITGDLADAFDNISADSLLARFAITGAPLSNAVNGKQEFEKGTLTKNGFKSNARSITSFTIPNVEEEIPTVIDEEQGTIYVFVDSSVSVTNIQPTIVNTGVSITPNTAQDFTNEVTYTVTAQNGMTKVYKVNIVKLYDTDIMSFEIDGVQADINHVTKTITAAVSGDYDLTKATATIQTRNTSATVSPATGEDVDLSNSWTNGVSFTSTLDPTTSTYTVQVRNKSKDTTITSFVIPDGQLQYQDKNGDVIAAIDKDKGQINLEYEYGNGVAQYAVAEVELADGATISPDPSVRRTQLGTKYTVTAEDGNTQQYTVNISVSTEATFLPVEEENLGIKVDFMTSRFSGSTKKKAATAIWEEYNNQRSMGTDLGTPVGNVEVWTPSTAVNRQLFAGGYGTGASTTLDQLVFNTMIMIDVPGGKAYTLKNTMLNLWKGTGVGDDGNEDNMYQKAGSAAVNEFTMNGTTYQQFSNGYGFYNNSKSGFYLHGIGTISVSKAQGLQTSAYYDGVKQTIQSEVAFSMRQAYERANLLGYNPGVADNGSTDFVSAASGGGLQYVMVGKTDNTFRDVRTANSKGMETVTREEGTFDNYLLYQVFTGSGDLNSTERDASNKTIVIKGTNKLGVDNGGGIALFNNDDYRIKDIYEALPGTKVALTIDGISFKFNRDLGTPINYLEDKDGNIVMTFKINTIVDKVDEDGNVVLDENGNPVKTFDEKLGYYLAEGGDPSKITWHDGNYLSNDNTLSSKAGAIKVNDSNAEIKVITNGDLYPGEDPDDENAKTFKEDAIYINYPAGATVDVKKIQFTKITTNNEYATVTEPTLIEDGTTYQTVDCEFGGQLYVMAEDESTKTYMVYVYQNSKSLMSDLLYNNGWNYWNEEPQEEVTYPYFDKEKQVWMYDYDPNASLKDDQGNPLVESYYGFYVNDDPSAEFIKVGKLGKWTPPATTAAWKTYYLEHFYGKF